MVDRISVVIIEDDAETRACLGDLLSEDSYHVFQTASIEEASRCVEGTSVDLVITDRQLPDGMVEDLMPRIREFASDADVIVVTGLSDVQSTVSAFRQGVSDYILKPVVPEQLRSTIERTVHSRTMTRELNREHQFADQILSTAEAIVLILGLDGHVMRFNRYFTDLTGWTQDRLYGEDWFENCVPTNERVRIRQVFFETAHELRTKGVVNEILCADGQGRQIRWSNATLRDAGGEVCCVLAIGIDVTEALEANRKLVQSERLAAIGETVTALAHESRNALQRIQASVELLEMELADRPQAMDDLRCIERASNDLTSLLEEVRVYAAPVVLKAQPCELSDVWRRVWGDLKHSHDGRHVELRESVNGCEVSVNADVMRLEQVFRNLFENSLAACDDPVVIDIKCHYDDGMVELRCCDNGPGLNPEQQAKLFDAFYTTKQGGTGLGMPICQRIIQAHGGSIQPHPSDHGACFVIRIPKTPR
ncbi:MAG: ATP-binding protein [Planctomycetota bacterium]